MQIQNGTLVAMVEWWSCLEVKLQEIGACKHGKCSARLSLAFSFGFFSLFGTIILY